MKRLLLPAVIIALAGCASIGGGRLPAPPEYDQTVGLIVSGDYQMFQATQSDYDVGDLQSFHSQHTFPIQIEDAMKQVFGGVQRINSAAGIEMEKPPVPAIFEVRMADLANDIYNEADTYRAQTVIAVAMKTPDGNIMWQKSFRGHGFVNVDPQFSTGLGPNDAVVAAVSDAITQMQDALIHSPEVQRQLKYYNRVDQARSQTRETL